MLRSLTPFLIVILAVLLDTAVIPVLYYGPLTIPLTLAVVMCAGLTLGKSRGTLLGMFGGLLVDITGGTLGVMTIFFLVCGFLVELFLDESKASSSLPSGIRFHIRHAITFFLMYLLGEIVFCIYNYFQTAAFEWFYLRSIFQRSGIFTAAAVLLYFPLNRIFAGKKHRTRAIFGNIREVKHF